jgi:CRISPR-associated protein Cas2
MRVIIMFDLPTTTIQNRRDYIQFRKYLIQSGFFMMQESVYCKLAQNATAANTIIANVKKNKPEVGLVQALKVTEKQYASIEFIVGSSKSEVLNSDERLVIL